MTEKCLEGDPVSGHILELKKRCAEMGLDSLNVIVAPDMAAFLSEHLVQAAKEELEKRAAHQSRSSQVK